MHEPHGDSYPRTAVIQQSEVLDAATIEELAIELAPMFSGAESTGA
jgi:hypothetical protein